MDHPTPSKEQQVSALFSRFGVLDSGNREERLAQYNRIYREKATALDKINQKMFQLFKQNALPESEVIHHLTRMVNRYCKDLAMYMALAQALNSQAVEFGDDLVFWGERAAELPFSEPVPPKSHLKLIKG